MQQFYSLLRQTLPLCTTLIIHWQSVKLYTSLICLYTSTALGNVVPRCHGGFHGHVLFWQQFLGTIWKTQSLIKKKSILGCFFLFSRVQRIFSCGSGAFCEYSIKRLEIPRVLLGNEHKQNSIQFFLEILPDFLFRS